MKPLAMSRLNSLRYAMLVPLALMIASVVTSCFSYAHTRQDISDDLNEAIIALAGENSRLWTRQDTIAALRKIHEATRKPLICPASDVNFRNAALKDEAYYMLALVDASHAAPAIHGSKIASDSIMLVPEAATDGVAVQVRGFADCSVASVFAASDQTLPGVLFVLSVLSMASMCVWVRRESCLSVTALDAVRLTPMQRQLAQMLLDAPGRKVDKATLCTALWGGKSNAEESLYTLVRRTKAALAEAGVEIVCHRGDSYEICIKR